MKNQSNSEHTSDLITTTQAQPVGVPTTQTFITEQPLTPEIALSPTVTKRISTPIALTPSATASVEVSSTPPDPTLTPTSLVLPEVIWSNYVEAVASFNAESLVWSPVSNEFVLDNCSDLPNLDEAPEDFIFTAAEPDFVPQAINPPDIFCSSNTKFVWRPNGQQILFNALPASSPLIESAMYDSTSLFIMDWDGENFRQMNTGGWLFNFDGWMNNSRLIKSSYRGGGNWIVSVYDIELDEELAWAWIYAHRVQNANAQYVATESGEPCCLMSAAVFSTNPLRPEPEPTPEIGQRMGLGPYVNHLSLYEEPREFLFNSSFEDWIDSSNQMLVLTWDSGVNLSSIDILHDASVTDLQIWDVDSDDLTEVVPGGIWGRISSDRRYLVYLQPSSNFPTLQLLDRNSGQIIFAQPALAELTRFSGKVDAFTSFSPDGRFLTYFDSTSKLVVFDLESGTILSFTTVHF